MFCMTACFVYSDLEHDNFLNTDISQGSVETQLRCGEILMANLLVNPSVKENFENQSTFGEVMGKILVACFLLTHTV